LCIDAIYKYDATTLYAQLAFPIAKEFNLLDSTHRHDTTTLSVSEDYEEVGHETEEPLISYGYSKDHQPDLKQITLLLTMTGGTNFPLWMESLPGNSSDKKVLQEAEKRVKAFRNQLKGYPDSTLVISDSALYQKELLNQAKQEKDFYFLTRVPETIKEAKAWCCKEICSLDWEDLGSGYKMITQEIEYGEIKQRWQLIYSEQAHQRESHTFYRSLEKEKEQAWKMLKQLQNQLFNCQSDGEAVIRAWNKKSKHYVISYQFNLSQAMRMESPTGYP
jgi:transposase